MTAPQKQGLFWAITATVISGFSVYVNALVVKGIDPMVHTTVKNAVAGLAVLLVLATTKHTKMLPKLKAVRRWQLVAIAFIGGSLPFGLFFTGLKMIGATQGAFLQKTLVIWIALLAMPFLKEKLSVKLGLGVGLVYFAGVMLGGSLITHFGWGHALVLMATLLWAGETIIVKKTLTEVPVNVLVSARMAGGAVILIGWLLVTAKMPLVAALSTSQWLMLGGVGLILFTYVMTWYRALKLLPATVVASVLTGAMLITTILDAGLTSKPLSQAVIYQGLILMAGIWLIWQKDGANKPEMI